MDFSVGCRAFFRRQRRHSPPVFIGRIEIGDRRAIEGQSMHSTRRPAYAAHAHRCAGRRARHWGRPCHARRHAPRALVGVLVVLRDVGPRQQRREGAGELRPFLCRSRGRAGRLCTTRSMRGTIVRPLPRPLTAQGRFCATLWRLCSVLILAMKHGVFACRPGLTTAVAPTGGPQHRPVHALARWRRLGTTRSGAWPSGEQEGEQRHA